MSFAQGMKNMFVQGRGDARGLPKTDEEVTHQESEILEDGEIFAEDQNGYLGNDAGAKPVYATGVESPFHKGRGPGRGHGPETPKNA